MTSNISTWTAAMVGMGRDRKAATTGRNESTMPWRRSCASPTDPADWAQPRSKPLEKNFPEEVVTRTQPGVNWAAASERAVRMDSMTVGLRRCSSVGPAPVRVRKKRSPRFSSVHMGSEPRLNGGLSPRDVCRDASVCPWKKFGHSDTNKYWKILLK